MEKTVVEMCAALVTAQVQRRWMTSEEIPESIRTVYGGLETLHRVADQRPANTGLATGVFDRLAALRRQPKQAIQEEKIICLECGREFRLLGNRHLALHGLTPRDYKRKWGMSMKTPLSARTLTAHRRETAKQIGTGKALADWRAARRPSSR